jgi:hypothetical protein
VEVQGGVDGPTVLLVGSSMLSWPNELCKRLVDGGRRVIRYDVRAILPADLARTGSCSIWELIRRRGARSARLRLDPEACFRITNPVVRGSGLLGQP